MGNKNSMGSGLQIREIKKLLTFPSLFSKLFVINLVIFAGLLVALLIIFSNRFQEYFINYTQENMINQATIIVAEFEALAQFKQTYSQTVERVLFKVEALESSLGATAWIIDRQNGIDIISKDLKAEIARINTPNDEALTEVFNGNIVKIIAGFEGYFSTQMMTIGYPIWMGDNVEYALFIHTPMPHILGITDDINRLILQASLILGVIMLMILLVLSRQMSIPLVQMNKVAKQIANGEFDKRVPVSSKDEIGQLAISLNYMAEELDKIETKRKAFLANVSHDMRSPLTSIQGFVTAILDGTIPESQTQRYLEIVLNESKRMIKMTNDILELNKLETSEIPLYKVDFDMHEMVRDMVMTFNTIILEKKVTVNLIFEDKVQEVIGDCDKIVRVIQNLLDNAFKFVNYGGLIEVETITRGDKLWIYVKNTGENIPQDELNSIWDRFYKSDLSRGKDKKGMGIGLVIVKEIIKQHQETIGVLSDSGEMTIFYFSIERAKKNQNIVRNFLNS